MVLTQPDRVPAIAGLMKMTVHQVPAKVGMVYSHDHHMSMGSAYCKYLPLCG